MSGRSIATRLAGIVAATAIMWGAGASHAIAAESAVEIDSVRAGSGDVELAITASNMPANVVLDSTTVQVTGDGVELAARVTSQGRSREPAKGEARGVVLLMDTSGSMEGYIDAARRAAVNYGESVPDDVRVGLVTFDKRPKLVLGPTTDREALADAVSAIRIGGETSLYDAIDLGVSTLDRLGGSGQRRLVVLSDGDDTTSATTLSAAATSLAKHDIVADVVAFRDGNMSVATRLADANEGQVLTADSSAELSAAFTSIATWYTERALISVEVPRDFAGETVTMTVTVTAEGIRFSDSDSVSIPGGLAWWFSWWPEWSWPVWVLGAITFTAILLSLLLLGGVGRGRAERPSIFDQIAQYGPHRKFVPEKPKERAFTRAALDWTEEMLRARGWEEKLAERLDLAGLRMKAAEWTLLRVCFGVVLAGVLMLLGSGFVVGVVLGMVLGWVGTMLFVTIKISRRRAAFADQLPDALQLVAGSLESGFSLAQALDAVVREDTQPIAGEFSRALAETRLGVELENALLRTALRMESEDLKWIVMAIRIQREVGGNLAEVLRNTVTTMRERAQTRRQVRALSAEGRLSAYVLLGLPFAMAGYFFVVRAEYMRPLYTTGMGLVMLAGSVIVMVLGSFWMSRLVKVEV